MITKAHKTAPLGRILWGTVCANRPLWRPQVPPPMPSTSLWRAPIRCFASPSGGFDFAGMGMSAPSTGGDLGKRKINTQTLCDLIGSKYYPHNEEIEMNEEKVVKCFDENDVLLGEMTLREARMAAETAKKDVVLRNAKISPPVVKIMNYKKELLKRLFVKLGKRVDEKDMKAKQVRL